MPGGRPVRGRGIGDVGATAQVLLLVFGVERSQVHALGLLVASARPEIPLVVKVTAIRQEDRPGVADSSVLFVQSGHRRRRAARLRHPMQGAVGREQDDALSAPRPSASARRVGERLRRAPGHVDFLQLPVGEKREEASVRGPERGASPLGPRQRLRVGGFKRPDPEPVLALGGPAANAMRRPLETRLRRALNANCACSAGGLMTGIRGRIPVSTQRRNLEREPQRSQGECRPGEPSRLRCFEATIAGEPMPAAEPSATH